MPKLLIATQNKGKLAEISTILARLDYAILTPRDVGISDSFDVAETGETYEANAELKAVAFGDTTHLLTVADDSGFSVNALGGRPGVYSKRYAPGTDADRNQKILEEMKDKTDRAAAFVTVLCLYDPENQEKVFFRGEVDGTVATQVGGESGFGYDPVFIPNGFTETFAELGQGVKNELSHRARALAQLKEYLKK